MIQERLFEKPPNAIEINGSEAPEEKTS